MKKHTIFLLMFVMQISILCSQTAVKDSVSIYQNRLSYSFNEDFAPFYHGVASGDALSNKVIIWTRVTPETLVDSIKVEWFVAKDTLFEQVVNQGVYYTNENRDYTVKIDVDNLEQDTWYYYYFRALDKNSIIGRTKTIPEGDNDSIRIAVVSGSNYNSGYFNVYKQIAVKNDIDAIFHLGDYIYEYETNHYGNHPERSLSPNHEILDLSDYRMRYSHYRLDPDLRYAHQNYPWYVEWDDHEIANNSWIGGAENHDDASEGNWNTRRSAGIQAFFEWIPVREINDTLHPENLIHRTFSFGDLAEFIFIDTRHEHRDDPEDLPVDDADKTMLGENQYNWFVNELYSAQYTEPVQWKIIANQVMFAPLKIAGLVVNKDQWDGYQHERQKILNYIQGMGIKNTVILTGDIHTSWANDVPNPVLGSYGDNGQGCTTVEFVTPSVTSPSTDFGASIGEAVIYSNNPHMKWVDLFSRGYYILDVNKVRTKADWFFLNTIDDTVFYENFASSWFVNNQENFLRQAQTPSMRLDSNPSMAPEMPVQNLHTEVDNINNEYNNNELVLIGTYPNPFKSEFTVQYYVHNAHCLYFQLVDIMGNIVYTSKHVCKKHDLEYFTIKADNIASGTYTLVIYSSETNKPITKKLIKLKY